MIRRIILLLTLALLLIGCGRTTDVVPTNLVQATTDVVTTNIPTDVPTPVPPTLEPSPAPGLVLIAGTDSVDPDVQSAIESLADESGWVVETSIPMDAASLRPETRVIVWLGDPAEARPLADAAQQVRVIAFTSRAAEASANLSWIVADTDQQAFAAGYITMLVTEDWRAGGLLPAEPANWTEAFLNGGRYLCGRCIPLYSPIVEFPVATTLPGGANSGAALEALAALNQQYYLDTVFIHPQISSDELLNQLAGQDFFFVGLQSPPDALKTQWAATVVMDLPAALRLAWPQGDAPGAVFTAPLVLQDINNDLLTEGKLKLLNQVLQDLQNGLISPLSVAP